MWYGASSRGSIVSQRLCPVEGGRRAHRWMSEAGRPRESVPLIYVGEVTAVCLASPMVVNGPFSWVLVEDHLRIHAS
jgi:hypothetical protein